jgi:hypothetical protein
LLVRGRSPLDEAAIRWRIWPSVQEVGRKAVVPVGQRLEEAVRSHCAEDAYDGNGAGIIGPRRLGKIGEPRRGVVAPQEHALRTAGDRCAVRIGGYDARIASRVALLQLGFQPGEQTVHGSERARLAAGPAADQCLPQHQRLGPGFRHTRHDARAADAGDGCQH